MDELDQRIIELLQLDGRVSSTRIARQLGVSESTVRHRVERLIQDDVVRISAVLNVARMGYTTTALIGIQTDPGRSDKVAEALATLEEVHYVAITTGTYDVFVWVRLESVESLGTFLQTKIGAIEGVQRAVTFVNLAIKKRAYGLGRILCAEGTSS